MSTFSCPVVEVNLEKHPNADLLSIAVVKGWNCVVATSDFKDDILGVYIPIDAIADKDHPVLGFLNGKKVKTIKLREYISQGVLLPLSKVINAYPLSFKKYPELGNDLSSILGIKKWEEPFKPDKMIVGSVGHGEIARPDWSTDYTDIENWNNYPDIIQENQLVEISEKLHGTCCHYDLVGNKSYIFTHHRCLRTEPKAIRIPRFKLGKFGRYLFKLAKKHGLDYWITKEKILPPEDTVWHRVYNKYNIDKKLRMAWDLLECDSPLNSPIAMYGEIYGVQKGFGYGLNNQELGFRVFDMRGMNGLYLRPESTEAICQDIGLEYVPILFRGPFKQELLELRYGNTTLKGKHIREGIVIKPLTPEYDPRVGRVILKKVSENYLMKNNKSDY